MRNQSKFILRSVALASAGLSLSCNLSCSGPPAATVANIVVDFPGTTASDAPLLLYSGTEAGNCVSFAPHVAEPDVTLEDVSFDLACTVEMDAFAPGLGAYANGVDPSDPSSDDWFVTAIESGQMSIALSGLTKVPLQLWLVASGSDVGIAEAKRDIMLNKAYPIFEAMGTGLSFDTASKVADPAIVKTKCDEADVIASDPAIYDASRINVYFLRDYAGLTNLTPGYNCWQQGHPEIAFISWGNTHLPKPTLAHELSHALGLVNPHAVGGHTYLVPGFGESNLMATNTDVTEITVGQLYALNFSSSSWLNRTGSPFLRPVVRSCQDAWAAGVCPALTMLEPGWPP